MTGYLQDISSLGAVHWLHYHGISGKHLQQQFFTVGSGGDEQGLYFALGQDGVGSQRVKPGSDIKNPSPANFPFQPPGNRWRLGEALIIYSVGEAHFPLTPLPIMQKHAGNAALYPIYSLAGEQEQIKRQVIPNGTEEVGFNFVAQYSYQKIFHHGRTSWVHYISPPFI